MRSAARLIRAVRTLASDQRIPQPLRLLVAAGALPIPGPVDELVLLVVAVPLLLFYRPLMREAWQTAEASDETGVPPAMRGRSRL